MLLQMSRNTSFIFAHGASKAELAWIMFVCYMALETDRAFSLELALLALNYCVLIFHPVLPSSFFSRYFGLFLSFMALTLNQVRHKNNTAILSSARYVHLATWTLYV